MPHDPPTPASGANAAADRDIISERVVRAPRERVFRAWTEAKHLTRWWGPAGFRNTFHECDPRPGGAWRFIMHGPNGTDYPNESRFVEIVRPERIVFDHLSAPRFRVTATFADAGGGTRVTFRMRFEDAQQRAALLGIIVPSNEQNFDRLEGVLAEMA